MPTDARASRPGRDSSPAPVPAGVADRVDDRGAGLAALLQIVVYRNGGREALADVPGRFFAWRLGGHAFPYLDRGVEYPVVIGYVAYALASVTGTATRFFVANGVIDVGLAVAMTGLLRVRGGTRIWRWIAAPPLVLFAFHNWDLLALVPAVLGVYAYMEHNDRVAGGVTRVRRVDEAVPGPVPRTAHRHALVRRRSSGCPSPGGVGGGRARPAQRPGPAAQPVGMVVPGGVPGPAPRDMGNALVLVVPAPGRVASFTHHHPAQLANLLAAVALVASIATITVLGVRRHLDAVAIGAAVTAAFLLTNKVYSPNYDLWIVPFFVLLPIARSHWLTFCAADIGIFTLVYGLFHGLWDQHIVHEMLPLFVAVRAVTLVLLIVIAVRQPRAAGDDDRAYDEPRTPAYLDAGRG